MRYSLREDGRNLAILLLLAGVLFGFGLGSFGLLDPDEPFYSLTAKEMLQNHDLLTPILFGQPQFEKPIFFYWVVYLSFKIFGVSEFASRFGPFLAGILTVLITYLWGVVLFKRRTIALVSAVVLATAAEFMVVSRIVLTDMVLCLFITAALFFFSLGYENQVIRKKAWFFIFVFCALGFLTKGPLGILLPWMGILGFLMANREAWLLKQFPWFFGLMAFSAIGIPWYALMTAKYGAGFLEHFFLYENVRRFFFAEHKSCDKLFFYPGALFIGFFPWGAFLLASLFHGFHRAFGPKQGVFDRPMRFLSLFFVSTFVFFTLAKSKLLSYILPVFPAVALLIGVWMSLAYRAVRQGAALEFSVRFLCVLLWGLLPLGLVAGVAIYGAQNNMGFFWPVFFLGLFLVPLSWAALWNVLRKKYHRAFYLMVAAASFAYVIMFGWIMGVADSAFSSKKDAVLYQKLISPDQSSFILANKLFVRGVTYYTGNERVGVLTGDPKSAFYSKHPVPMISSFEDLTKMDKNLFPIYCFLKPKDLEFLKQIAGDEFFIATLQPGANRILVRLDRAA